MRALLAALAVLAVAGCAGPGIAPGRPVDASGVPTPVPFQAPPAPVEAGRARSFVAVAERIEPVAEAECARRRGPGVDCDLQIVVDDRPGMPPNAFQTVDRRGRPILGVTVALIELVENEDEMAFVLAHEASHHVLGHLGRQDEVAAIGAEVFGRLAAGEAGATPVSIRQAREVGAAVGARSFSKDFELEADALGAIVAGQAGFDARRGAAFFLRIPDPGNRVLGTHPSNADRIAIVEAAVEGRYVP